MYCLSSWIALIICRLRRKKTVIWGHGLYGNESNLKLIFRKLFNKLADKQLVYERRAKRLLIKQGFDPNNLYIVFNSLDYDTQKTLRAKLSDYQRKIYLVVLKPRFASYCFHWKINTRKKSKY